MQIVIDINEHLYKTIKTLGLVVEDGDAVAVSEAIMHGTPLPKGHGDLIDRGALKLSEERHTEMGEYNLNVEHTYYTRYYSVNEIKNAPTIIKADTEQENKDADSN